MCRTFDANRSCFEVYRSQDPLGVSNLYCQRENSENNIKTRRNWGLTDPELKTIPPALVRGFRNHNGGGLGSELPGNFGRLLMRNAYNSELYGPLQEEYLKGQKAGTDVWIHKNRFVFFFIKKKNILFDCVCSISGLWGYQTALDLFLQENGITTLLFSGVNSDQVFFNKKRKTASAFT
jgi:nicotinamidase-related amidase